MSAHLPTTGTGYFSPRTLRDPLEREGFEVVVMRTRVSSLTPVPEWLRYREPYSDVDTGADPLARELLRNQDRIEALIEELDLGYKLHCLAVRGG